MIDINNNYPELFQKIHENNLFFSQNLGREKQKEISHFSTPNNVAEYMANRLVQRATDNIDNYKILDPGAGTGTLGIIVILKLIKRYPNASFCLIAYENDHIIANLLYKNLQLLSDWLLERSYDFSFEVRTDDYILEDNELLQNSAFKHEKNYDLIIANPPYKKVIKSSPYVETMPFIVYGAPNKYSFFLAKSVIELKQNATMVYIVPRSWMSGKYFEKFRQFILKLGSITELHSFDNRNNIFGKSKVLQELVIIVFTKKQSNIIDYYHHESIDNLGTDSKIRTTSDTVIVGPEKKVYSITKQEQLEVIDLFRSFKTKLSDTGLKMHTGLTVCFRNKNNLRNSPDKDNVPIFYSKNLSSYEVNLNKEVEQYITIENSGLLQKNKNYLFIKRFSTKEESRRIQLSFYNSDKFKKYSMISTDNKLNFVSSENEELLKGAFIIMASTKFDEYYRLLNGNTQVNSSEINEMFFPPKEFIKCLSRKISINNISNLSQQNIDSIFDHSIYEWRNRH